MVLDASMIPSWQAKKGIALFAKDVKEIEVTDRLIDATHSYCKAMLRIAYERKADL